MPPWHQLCWKTERQTGSPLAVKTGQSRPTGRALPASHRWRGHTDSAGTMRLEKCPRVLVRPQRQGSAEFIPLHHGLLFGVRCLPVVIGLKWNKFRAPPVYRRFLNCIAPAPNPNKENASPARCKSAPDKSVLLCPHGSARNGKSARTGWDKSLFGNSPEAPREGTRPASSG